MKEKSASVWILGDQLLKIHPAIGAAEEKVGKSGLRVVFVESHRRAERLPYHRKKLVLLFSAMRHFALELEEAGYQVDYRRSGSIMEGLRAHIEAWSPEQLFTMAASEHAGRAFQESKLGKRLGIPVHVLPNTQFLVGRFDPYPEAAPDQRVVMENFYRAMRRHFEVLMVGEGEPEGGRWNFDKENRKPLPKDVVAPPLPEFPPDEITLEVMAQVAEMADGTGRVDGFNLAVEHIGAQAAFEDFLENRLADFGPYEDAMDQENAVLFHSFISPYLNIGLLEPLPLVRAAEAAYHEKQAPINSVEGFVRQILGWREYIYWQYWRMGPAYLDLNFWSAQRELPGFFWDSETDLNCLRQVLARVRETGYAHHIERLMLLSNFCQLAGIDPLAVNDWFLVSFIDAYEWVMQPNVLGMGLFADGGLTATKPYIASANYINRMSNYCGTCSYNQKARTGDQACPFNLLYWNFLLSHEAMLRANPRLGPNVLGLRHLKEDERLLVLEQAEKYLNSL